MQELTSLVHQEWDKSGTLEKKNTKSHTFTRTDIQMAPWKDKHLLKYCLSAFCVSLGCITEILHTVHSGIVCHSATHKLGPMKAVEDWFIAQNRPDWWGHKETAKCSQSNSSSFCSARVSRQGAFRFSTKYRSPAFWSAQSSVHNHSGYSRHNVLKDPDFRHTRLSFLINLKREHFFCSCLLLTVQFNVLNHIAWLHRGGTGKYSFA